MQHKRLIVLLVLVLTATAVAVGMALKEPASSASPEASSTPTLKPPAWLVAAKDPGGRAGQNVAVPAMVYEFEDAAPEAHQPTATATAST
jgi:hypothetical protein